MPPDTLLEEFRAGATRALARAISRAESGGAAALIHDLYDRTGRALTIGLTGPPGVGKSTICSALVRVARSRGNTVGVISVDPSSPFSKGALLGDRIRLTEHFMDADVFIRSMASRGHLGGVAGATADAVLLMDAFGKDVVIVETVGVGQSEIEIAELAQTTIVALQPGSGDSVQVLKAGILEVADIFVVNKADHPMALQMQREIRSMMEMLNYSGWIPELVLTNAIDGTGIDELYDAILTHDAYLRETDTLREKRRAAFAHQVRSLAVGRLERRVDAAIAESIWNGESSSQEDPYAAADRILSAFGAEPADLAAAQRTRVRATVKGL